MFDGGVAASDGRTGAATYVAGATTNAAWGFKSGLRRRGSREPIVDRQSRADARNRGNRYTRQSLPVGPVQGCEQPGCCFLEIAGRTQIIVTRDRAEAN
jgi:hypothetical protein